MVGVKKGATVGDTVGAIEEDQVGLADRCRRRWSGGDGCGCCFQCWTMSWFWLYI